MIVVNETVGFVFWNYFKMIISQAFASNTKHTYSQKGTIRKYSKAHVSKCGLGTQIQAVLWRVHELYCCRTKDSFASVPLQNNWVGQL